MYVLLEAQPLHAPPDCIQARLRHLVCFYRRHLDCAQVGDNRLHQYHRRQRVAGLASLGVVRVALGRRQLLVAVRAGRRGHALEDLARVKVFQHFGRSSEARRWSGSSGGWSCCSRSKEKYRVARNNLNR